MAHLDLELALAKAGGDLELVDSDAPVLDLAQALGDLGLGEAEKAKHHARIGLSPVQHLPDGVRLDRDRPHRVKLARRSGHDDHDGAIVDGHDQPWRGSGRVDQRRALGHHGLLPVRLAERFGVEVEPASEAGEDLGDLLLHALVEHHLAPGEGAHDLRGEVVRGRPEAAAGDDQVHAVVAQEPECLLEV